MEGLIRHLRSAKTLFLVAHVNPDGDALGSLFACAEAFQQQGISAVIVIPEDIPEVFHFLARVSLPVRSNLPNSNEIPESYCLVLDAPDSARTPFPEAVNSFGRNERLLLIDHHPAGDLSRLATASLHRTTAASTTELCEELFREMGVRFTPSISLALLTGMYTDTGGFQLSNTTTHTLETAAELMRRGGRLTTITQALNRHKTVSSLRLLGTALERIRVTNHGRCLISVLKPEDFTATGAHPDETVGIISQINSLPDSALCLLITEPTPGTLRGSLRSGNGEKGKKVNVGRLARLLGGGGHPRASGFLLPGTLKEKKGHWQVDTKVVA